MRISARVSQLELVVKKSVPEVSAWVTKKIAAGIKAKPDLVLGLKTGATAIPVYNELVRFSREEKINWEKVTTFNLDEYLGMSPAHPESYRAFMDRHLFSELSRLGLKRDNIHLPDTATADAEGEIIRYVSEIKKAGGVDLWILGIGSDGHFGFLEPAPRLGCQDLAQRAYFGNSGFFKVRDFNEFVMEDEDPGLLEQNIREVLKQQKKYRKNLGDCKDLLRSFLEVSKKADKDLSVEDAEAQLNILGERMLKELEVTFYVALPERERRSLKSRIIGENLKIRGKKAFFGDLGKITSLAIPTLIDNSRFFNDVREMSLKALTATGIVKESKGLIQVITGKHKARALLRTMALPETSECPTTTLKDHPDFTIVCDEDAYSLLKCAVIKQ